MTAAATGLSEAVRRYAHSAETLVRLVTTIALRSYANSNGYLAYSGRV
jgi:hypothetical protein